jgi:hypothetical protein
MTASEPVLTKIASDLNLRPCRHQVQLHFTFHSPTFDALVRAYVLQKLMCARHSGLHAANARSQLFCAMLLVHPLALAHYLSRHPFCTDSFVFIDAQVAGHLFEGKLLGSCVQCLNKLRLQELTYCPPLHVVLCHPHYNSSLTAACM